MLSLPILHPYTFLLASIECLWWSASYGKPTKSKPNEKGIYEVQEYLRALSTLYACVSLSNAFAACVCVCERVRVYWKRLCQSYGQHMHLCVTIRTFSTIFYQSNIQISSIRWVFTWQKKRTIFRSHGLRLVERTPEKWSNNNNNNRRSSCHRDDTVAVFVVPLIKSHCARLSSVNTRQQRQIECG